MCSNQVLKPEFPYMLCGIRNSHGVNPGKEPNTMYGCHMWFETKNLQSTNYYKLVQEMKSYGSWASANKSRWKSAKWKDSKPPEPSSNVAIWCPVFWKRYLNKQISQNHANFMMTPTIVSRISMYLHERDHVKIFFENPVKFWLPSVPRMARTHTTVIAHFDMILTTKIMSNVYINPYLHQYLHIYICWKWKNLTIYI